MQRVSMRKRLRVDHRQKWRWLSLLEPHRESCRPVGDRRANVLTANCATQALQLHQPSDRAACHRNAFPAHLLPDLRHAADRLVDLPDTLALRLQDLIAFGASAAFGRITKLRSMASVARRRNPQDLADRLAPEGGAMLINEGLQDLKRRSSSSRLTQSHSVCGVQPIIGAIDSTAAHFDGGSLRCSRTRRTARSRTSGENLPGFLFVHGSIPSRVGASTKLGAVHTAVLQPSLKRVVHRVAVALLN